MHNESDFEDLVLKNTTVDAMNRFAAIIEWPPHLCAKYSVQAVTVQEALGEYFSAKKADWGIADFLAQCTEDEIPLWLREACKSLGFFCDPPAAIPVTSTVAPPLAPPPSADGNPSGS